jgi:multisubunit Na+/H+ antiporter MnhB subunit
LEAFLMPLSTFDVLLGATLIGVAVRVLTASDLFQAIVLFIVFGLLMSVAWTRLHAVDVALAEAAIGAGLTGALFLNALGQSEHGDGRTAADRRHASWLRHVPTIVLALCFALVVGSSLAGLPAESIGLRDLIGAHIRESGASNPVTAVLLNFRAYDTLLEIAVLVLAVVGVWALGPAPAPTRGVSAPPGPVLLALVRVLTPLIGVIAGYLLWIGAKAPGGAFQSGAVLGASGILLVVTGIARAPNLRHRAERGLIVLGFTAFLVVSLGVMVPYRQFLEYPPTWASWCILLIETLLTISIATILVALFAGGERKEAPVTSPGDK